MLLISQRKKGDFVFFEEKLNVQFGCKWLPTKSIPTFISKITLQTPPCKKKCYVHAKIFQM